GQFNDWAGVATEAMASGGVLNPNVDIVRFGVVPNLGPIAFFVEVAGSALTGGGPSPGTMDTVRIFIDIDGSASSGYRIDGLGADRMIEVSGYAGRVQSSTLWEFDANRNQRDWNGWIKGTSTPAAASGSRIEAEAQWLADVPTSVPVVATVHTVSWDKQVDRGDFPVSPGFGTLSIVSDPQVPDIIAGNDVPLRPPCSSSAILLRRRATHSEFGFRRPILSAWMGALSLCMKIQVPGPSATSASSQRRPGSMVGSTSGRRSPQTLRTM